MVLCRHIFRAIFFSKTNTEPTNQSANANTNENANANANANANKSKPIFTKTNNMTPTQFLVAYRPVHEYNKCNNQQI